MRVVDVRDDERRHVSFSCQFVAAPGAEAATTMTIHAGPAYSPTTANNYTVNAGKRLRIVAVLMGVQTAGAVNFTFRIRLTTALTGNLIYILSARPQAAGYHVVNDVIPEGIELHGDAVLRFSLNSSGAGNVDLNVHCYEY